jgi:hypothetical protein
MRGTERYADEVRGGRTGRRSGAKVTNYSYVEARGAGAAKTNEETRLYSSPSRVSRFVFPRAGIVHRLSSANLAFYYGPSDQPLECAARRVDERDAASVILLHAGDESDDESVA